MQAEEKFRIEKEEAELLHNQLYDELDTKLKNVLLRHEAAITEEGTLVKNAMEESFIAKNELKTKMAELEANNKLLENAKHESDELQKQLTEMKDKIDIKFAVELVKDELHAANDRSSTEKEEFLKQLKLEEDKRSKLERELLTQKAEMEKIRIESQNRVEENLSKLTEAVEAIKSNQEEQSVIRNMSINGKNFELEDSMDNTILSVVNDEFVDSEELQKRQQVLEDKERELEDERERLEEEVNVLREKESEMQLSQGEHEETLLQLKKALRRVVQMKQKEYGIKKEHEEELLVMQKEMDDAVTDKKLILEEKMETEKLILKMTGDVEKERMDKKKVIAQLHEKFKEYAGRASEAVRTPVGATTRHIRNAHFAINWRRVAQRRTVCVETKRAVIRS